MAENSPDLPLKLAQARQALKDAQARVAQLEAERATDLTPPADNVQADNVQADVQLERHIAEIQRTNEALRRSEALFRGTFEQAAVGIAHCDLDGHWRQVNQRLCDIVGYTAAELAGKTFQELTHPADLADDVTAAGQLLQGEIQFYTMHKRYFHRCGHIVWINLTVSLVRDGQGLPDYFVAVVEDITQLKQTEQALLQSEERYRRVVEDQVDLIGRFQPDFKLTFVNRAYSEALGKRPDELIGQNILDLIPPEYHAGVIAHLSALTPAKPTATAENPLRLADGTLHWFQWTDRVTLDEAGHILEYQGVGRDITEQKKLQAEQQFYLQVVEEMHQFSESTLNAFAASTAVLASDGTIIKINAAWRNFSDENEVRSATHYLGENYLAVCDSAVGADCAEAAPTAAGIRAVIAGHQPTFYLEYPCHTNVEKRWFGLRVTPFTEPPPRRVVVAHSNITQRIQTETVLRASEERFRRYFELGLIGMAITSPTQGILEANDQLCTILGYERDELLHANWAELTHPDDLALDIANFERVMAGEIDGYLMDKRWIRKDGAIIDSTISVKCLRHPDGSVDYFVALVQDITERKRAEVAEQEQRRFAEALRDSLAALTASLDVKSVMQCILDYAATVVPYDAGSIILLEGDYGRVAYLRGFTPEAIAALTDYQFPLESLTYGNMLIDKTPYFIPDTQASPEWITVPLTDWIRSSIGIPIEIRGKIIGVLVVDSRTPDHFQPKDIEKLQAFARYASLALENAYHVTELEQRVVERTAELQLAKERVEAVLNNSFDSILLVYPDLRIQQTNSAFNTLVGAQPGEAFAGSLRDLIHLDDGQRVSDLIQAGILAQTGKQIEIRCYRKNGVIFDAELSIGYLKAEGLVLTLRDITERKRAHNALAEERNLLRTLIDAMPDLIYIKDLKHQFVLCNAASGHILHNQKSEELIGKTDFDFFPRAVAEEFHANEEAIFQTGQALTKDERPMVDQDGRTLWISTTKVPLHNLNGEMIGLAGFSRDITTRKAQEQQLRYQASLQENVNDAVIATDLEFRIQSWNKAAEQMYGWRADEAIGKPATDLLQTKLTYDKRNSIRATLFKTERWSGELSHQRKDGAEFVVLSTITLLKDEQGEPFGSVTVNHDITERKRAQNALAEERNLLRTLIDTLPDFIYVKDTNHRLVLTNVASARSFGVIPEETLGKDDFGFFPPEMARQFQAAEDQILQSGVPLLDAEERTLGPNGSAAWASITKVPLRNLNGEIIGLVGINRDITERKERERQLLFHASLQETVADAVIATDLEFRIQSWNRAAETIYGWRAEEVMGKPANEILQTQIAAEQTIEQALHDLLEKGCWSDEVIQRHKTGHTIHILSSTVLFKDAQGIPLGVVAVNHDITERKKTEQAMHEKMEEERTFQNYLKALHEITIELTQIDDLDDFYEQAIVLGRSQLGFDRMALFLYDAQQDSALGTFGTDIAGQISDERRMRFTPGQNDIMRRAFQATERFCLDGPTPLYHNMEQVGFGWNAAAALRSGAQLIGWLVTDNLLHRQPATKPLMDIFALYALTVGTLLGRKQIQAALRESETRYRLLAENITDMVVRLNLAAEYLYVSPSSEALLGYTPAELVGQSGYNIIHPDDLTAIQQVGRTAVENNRPFVPVAVRFRHKQGHYVWLEISGQTIYSDKTSAPIELITSSRDVTQRKQAEEALRESEEKFRRLVEVAPVAIIISDQTGQIILANHEAGTLFGYPETELVGQPVEVLVPEALRALHVNSRTAYTAAPRVRRMGNELELFARRKDGSEFPVEIELSYIETKAGLLVMSFVMDITERKQNAAALEEQRTFLRQVIDVSPSMIFVKDYNARFVLVNPIVAKMYNTTVDALLGKSDADFNPDQQEVAAFLAADRRVIDSEEPLFIEEPVTSSNGETHWLQTTKVPIISADGKSKYVLGVATDITARKKAEEALRQNEELLRTVLENLPVGIWITNAIGTIRQGNLAGQQIWAGVKYAKLDEYNIYKAWWADTGQRLSTDEWASTRALTKGETVLNQELEIEAFDGVHKYMLNSAIPIRDAQQTIRGAIIVNQEITERKQNEKRIREALAKEKELGELKSRFVSMASHEFRTPLASILALTETLRAYRQRLSEDQIEQRLGKIQEQVGHLKDIMEDMLQLARLQARRTEFNPTRFNLDELCRSILDEFQNQTAVAHQLIYTCSDALHDVKLDKKLMRQIINNLLSNAVKYSPADTTIRLSLADAHEMLVLTVRDEGIGIPAADLNHLFEPFHRAVNVGTISGTGLGLVITKESVELHGGTITLESEVGVGTTFIVSIPIVTNGAKEHDKNLGD